MQKHSQTLIYFFHQDKEKKNLNGTSLIKKPIDNKND
jgi:hypothetical protein